MFKKKKSLPEPNILTKRFAQGPPTPNQREGGKISNIFIFIGVLLLVAFIAVQFITIDTEEIKHWTDAAAVLTTLKKNSSDKKALAALERIANVIDDTEANREARTGLLTVYTLGSLYTGARDVSYTTCKSLSDRYPDSSFAEMLKEDKLCKKTSSKDEKCPVCNGKGTPPELQSLSTSSGSGQLGKVKRKCLTCKGTGKKKGFQETRIDKDKVRSQYDEARSRTMHLVTAKKSIGKSKSILSKLQLFKNSASEKE